MNINETTNFNSTVIVKDSNGVDTTVMHLNASLNSGNMNINISANTINKTLAEENAESVKIQYEEFETAVKTRALELGYVIF